VLARPSALADRTPLNISSAFTRAPHVRVILACEADCTEDGAALVADFAREDSVLQQEFVGLPIGEQHG
jgi:hypothetical protein